LLYGKYITNENSTTICQSPSIDAPLKDVMKQMIKPISTESGLLIRSDVAQRLMQPKKLSNSSESGDDDQECRSVGKRGH